MKTLKYIVFTAFFMAASCTDFGDTNVDPDVSPTANPKEVLTSAQGFSSYVLEGLLNANASLWAQYVTWGPGVALGNAERYISEPSDFNGIWTRSYANTLTDLKFLVESKDNTYVGMGKIMQAQMYQLLVDHFGDVPFSEALKGETNDGAIFAPKYDDDKTVYAGAIKLIEEGITAISAGSSNPGSSDLMFGGDVSKWIKYANSLKLRMLMRQSTTSDQSAAVNALLSSGSFIETPADVADVAFAGTAGSENPMYARYEVSLGNFYVASNASLNTLLNDPRLSKLYNKNAAGVYRGIDQGGIDLLDFTEVRTNFSEVTSAVYSKNNAVVFMSDAEVWLLRAEAAVRYGAGDAAAIYAKAVQASFTALGAGDATTYVTDQGFASKSNDEKIKSIAIEKWIACNGTQEAEGWAEARRFDTPGNQMFTGEGGIWKTPAKTALGQRVFPTIYLYPESEQSFNPNAPTQRLITAKVFWDN